MARAKPKKLKPSTINQPSKIVTLKVSPAKLAHIFERPHPLVGRRDPSTVTRVLDVEASRVEYRAARAAQAAKAARATANATSSSSRPSSSKRPHASISSLENQDDDMAEGPNSQKAAAADNNAEGGLPFYEEERKRLGKLLDKRRKLAERLAQREELIEQKETEYLESTPSGNILTGFDNYTKGTPQAAAAQRRKAGPPEQHRVFSRSSISYNPMNSASDSATTPGSSHAPTPVSANFGGSNHPTPTSAGGSNRPSAGGAPRDRKRKVVAGADAGESESDAKEMKKVRTNFGASRK